MESEENDRDVNEDIRIKLNDSHEGKVEHGCGEPYRVSDEDEQECREAAVILDMMSKQ